MCLPFKAQQAFNLSLNLWPSLDLKKSFCCPPVTNLLWGFCAFFWGKHPTWNKLKSAGCLFPFSSVGGKKKIGSSAVKSKQWKETAEEDISGSRGLPAHSTLFALQSKVVSHRTSLQQSRGSENLKATAHWHFLIIAQLEKHLRRIRLHHTENSRRTQRPSVSYFWCQMNEVSGFLDTLSYWAVGRDGGACKEQTFYKYGLQLWSL